MFTETTVQMTPYQQELIERALELAERPRAVHVVMPAWIPTLGGFIVIGLVAIMAALIAQARFIDSLDTKLSIQDAHVAWMHGEVERTKADVRDKNEQLAELQNWRVVISIATRQGWDSAHAYIRETRLAVPPFVVEGRPIGSTY